MLKSDIPEIFSLMDLVLQELHSLTSSTNSTIRAKAKKVCHWLYIQMRLYLARWKLVVVFAGSPDNATVGC